MLASEVIEKLKDIVGREGVLTNPDPLAAHVYDVGGEGQQVPDGVVFPLNVEQMSAVMGLANRENVTVLPEGKGSRRYLPFSLERTLVFSTVKMNRILHMDRDSLKVTVEAGTSLKTLRDALDREGLYFLPYPWCFETSTVGGCAGGGIGGPARVRHGVFKQYVLGMEVVLPSGEVTRIGGQTVKNVVGYDLTSLFCGSEGALGIITSLTLRLVSKPPAEKLLIMGFPSTPSACAAMEAVTVSGRGPERLSMLDPWATRKMASFSSMKIPWSEGTTLLCQVAGLEEVVEGEAKAFLQGITRNGGKVIAVLQTPADIVNVWHAQGLCLSAFNDAAPFLMTWDMVVPRKKALYMMEKIEKTAQKRHLNLAHGGYYGNGVFHPVILMTESNDAQRKNAEVAFRDLLSFAVSQGGNGAGPFRRVGTEMAKFHCPHDPSMPGLSWGIKGALDPKGIMKPLSLSLGNSK